MDFPLDVPKMDATTPSPLELATALGLAKTAVLAVGRGRFDLLVEVTPTAFDEMLGCWNERRQWSGCREIYIDDYRCV